MGRPNGQNQFYEVFSKSIVQVKITEIVEFRTLSPIISKTKNSRNRNVCFYYNSLPCNVLFLSTLNEPNYKKHTKTIDTMTIDWTRETKVGAKSKPVLPNNLSVAVFVYVHHLPLSNLNFFIFFELLSFDFFCKSLSSLVCQAGR